MNLSTPPAGMVDCVVATPTGPVTYGFVPADFDGLETIAALTEVAECGMVFS